MSWKHEIEKTSMSYYSLQTSEKMGIYSYYYCQHDGSSKSHLKGKAGQKKRECAFKGRIKTGMVCTSMMQVKKVDGQVHVTFHPNHSHAIDVDFTQCQKIFNIKQFDKLNSELSKYVHSDNFPKDLLRHVKGVLSKLIAECASACNNNNIQPTTVPNMQPTQKRTSTEKLVCQALPPKKKKKS